MAFLTGCAIARNVGPAPETELIRATELRRVRALVDGDTATARALHAVDFQLITPSGAVLNREEYLASVGSGESDYLLWDPGEIEVRRFGDGAVLRYRSRLEIVVRGNRLPARPHWHTDYYEKRDGRWQVVWSQATFAQP